MREVVDTDQSNKATEATDTKERQIVDANAYGEIKKKRNSIIIIITGFTLFGL